jgi:hypothetical protein
MELVVKWLFGMVIIFASTYLIIGASNRYTNPGVRYRENSEYHTLGVCYGVDSYYHVAD